ncbi:RNA polymerase subunit AC19 [Coemansia sp. RSA 2706]|nr:RNA polymerase subunit AC19 [Coemansia sp. RSA 2708]KAJ2305868.1 RNA polymerase subunit AC19 [Coemansia sp. RSA 2706]KAJ2311249.1 RNA polymerase subunit AC19 [Coemansia sp. RSA 2705]KAJ2326292.1 RNA polymerase subunit AC19 [Coemansia sp. RSA 2702]KAJ2366160.1 RNA polymerase subunit AC19 [Coemansia sp. RSA 2610]KAJ2389761.1 RNA polymerase subunit AC19 [Coemansia sp. RSA 2611]KAJ2733972.1 RNA polymerase subunit AC19 [Coemansia sp. Cherry 401B]
MDVDTVEATPKYIALLSVPDNKIELLPGASADLTSVTFCIKEEDHTLGNSLRWAIMQNPQVDFCGYSIPHPSEAKMNVRIQTTEDIDAVKAMDKGITDLKSVYQHIKSKFQERIKEGNYARIE